MEAGPNAEISPGNALPLRNIPTGTVIHNLELTPGRGGQLVRSAGTGAQVLSREGEYVLDSPAVGRNAAGAVELPGKRGPAVESRPQKRESWGRPGPADTWDDDRKVRGVAKNPVDHPHGGGEGRSPIGMPGPKSPWGKPTLGHKTRRKKKTSGKFVIRGRRR